MKSNNQKKYEQYSVRQVIYIEKDKYSYKCNLKDETNFVYRCIHKALKVQITIDKVNILRALEKKDSTNIQYTLGKNKHRCQIKGEIINKEVNQNSILTSNEIKDLGLNLIKHHIDKL